MQGPGRYDDLCTLVREKADATVALVIIINGNLGSGFSVQMNGTLMPPATLAAILHDMANQIAEGEG